MDSDQTIYRLIDVTKAYDGRVVLRIPDLSFRRGETCAFVGPNGSGKTTLLRLLAFIEKPTTGRIFFDSVPLWENAAQRMPLTRGITMVTNPPYLFNRSVAYNIAYGMRLRGMTRRYIREKTLEVLNVVRLEGFERRDARKLSSGEQQRVALARALALGPDVLLLDEPTASIDKKHAEEVESLVRELSSQRGITVIFSTHNHQQAASLAERVVSLYDGRAEPFAYENLFGGEIFEFEGGKRIRLDGSITMSLVSGRRGSAHVSIDPHDISISHEPDGSGSVNCYQGKITSMTMHNSHVKLVVDAGVKLTSMVTTDSFRKLDLGLGDDVYCIFSPGAVKPI